MTLYVTLLLQTLGANKDIFPNNESVILRQRQYQSLRFPLVRVGINANSFSCKRVYLLDFIEGWSLGFRISFLWSKEHMLSLTFYGQ